MNLRGSASPQDTFDHIFGSGAESYSWYMGQYEALWGVPRDGGNVTDTWVARISMEHPTSHRRGASVTAFINYERIMKTAVELVGNFLLGSRVEYMSEEVVRQCANMIFNPDAMDFDADSADQLLQYMVLGKVVYG